MLRRLSLPNELFPVKALFNAIPENKFGIVLGFFSKGIGVGFDEACCEFSATSEDDSYQGARCWIFDEEATLTNEAFLSVLSAPAKARSRLILMSLAKFGFCRRRSDSSSTKPGEREESAGL